MGRRDAPAGAAKRAFAWRGCRPKKPGRDLARDGRKTIHILRLAGIYGPGRNALVAISRTAPRSAIVKKDQVFNRIHVDDISTRDRGGDRL